MSSTSKNVDKILLSKDAPFAIREAYKAARTNLLFSMVEEECKKIAFTSDEPGAGKSSAVIQIASSLCELGRKTLVIDCDLRLPTISKKLSFSQTPGLTNILIGSTSFIETVNHHECGFDVLTAGDIPPNPSELLGSENFRKLIKLLEREYEYILFDAPPVASVTDVTMLKPILSGVVIVVRSGSTEKNQVSEAVKKLEIVDMKIIGFLLVGAKESRKKYEYTYGNYKQ